MTNDPPLLILREQPPDDPHPPDNLESMEISLIAALINRWRYERAAYPGWVVAPERSRTQLWLRTRGWFFHFCRNYAELQAVDRLLLFREANWRLETSMVPLFNPLVDSFRDSLKETYNSLLGNVDLKPSKGLIEKIRFDRNDVVCAWLEISLGLLREARETYNSAYWGELHGQIANLVDREPQYADRFRYEELLYAIWNLQRERARELLYSWQPSLSDTRATIWKAGLLAELNDLGEARALLKNSLRTLEQAQQPKEDIRFLSLEGWCSYMLAELEKTVDYSQGLIMEREIRDRLSALRQWDCDPRQVRSLLRKAIQKSAPQPKKIVTKKQQFDLGKVSLTHTIFSADIDEYLPAFAYIRHLEDVGIPFRLDGAVDLVGRELRNACEWISQSINYWSPAILIRAGQLDAITNDYEYLRRDKIAVAEQEFVNSLYVWCSDVFDRETVDQRTAINSRDLDALLSCLVEVLSRLACRLDDTRLTDSFRRAISVYPWIGGGLLKLRNVLQRWLFRLYSAAEAHVLLTWYPELLRAPLDQNVFHREDHWTDASEDFPFSRVKDLPLEESAKHTIDEAILWLFKKADSETGAARARAVLRLIDAYFAGFLSKTQGETLGNLLWSNREPGELPNAEWLKWSALATLPHPATVDVAELLKDKIWMTPATEGGLVTFNAEGRVQFKSTYEPAPDLILRVGRNTKLSCSLLNAKSGIVTWSSSEALELCERALNWWSTVKPVFEKTLPPMVHLDKKRLGASIGKFLIALIPYIESGASEIFQKLLSWIEDLRSHQIYATSAIPYLVKSHPEIELNLKLIADDLDGSNENAIDAAADATVHLVSVNLKQQFPTNEQLDTSRILLQRVAFRRKPALNACITRLVELLVHFPNHVDLESLTQVCASLVPWLEKLSLTTDVDDEFLSEERPTYRYQLGYLAGALSEVCKVRQVEMRSSDAWRKAVESDASPEIRRAFSEGIELFNRVSSGDF